MEHLAVNPIPAAPGRRTSPSPAQRAWLRRGLGQPGGKLSLFDEDGQRMNARTIRACIAAGWAEPWFYNPLKPDWLVCRLTPMGRGLFDDE
jgi:hypothetical protein